MGEEGRGGEERKGDREQRKEEGEKEERRHKIRGMEKAFYKIVGGVENRVVRGKGSDTKRENEEEEISQGEEVKTVIAKLKDGKAAGGDKISNEV